MWELRIVETKSQEMERINAGTFNEENRDGSEQ